ncbi:hypothetical protein BCV70DRAFT_234115, partial [Testicularia cyperi]
TRLLHPALSLPVLYCIVLFPSLFQLDPQLPETRSRRTNVCCARHNRRTRSRSGLDCPADPPWLTTGSPATLG